MNHRNKLSPLSVFFALALAALCVPILAHAAGNGGAQALLSGGDQTLDQGVSLLRKILGYLFDVIALIGGGSMAIGAGKFKDRYQDGQPDPKATKEAAWKIGGGFLVICFIYMLRQVFPALPSFLGMA